MGQQYAFLFVSLHRCCGKMYTLPIAPIVIYLPEFDLEVFVIGVLWRHLLADVGVVLWQVHIFRFNTYINSNCRDL